VLGWVLGACDGDRADSDLPTYRRPSPACDCQTIDGELDVPPPSHKYLDRNSELAEIYLTFLRAGMLNYVMEQVVEDLPCVRLRTGVCPQTGGLWDELTAAEHLEIYAAIRAVRRRPLRPLGRPLDWDLPVWRPFLPRNIEARRPRPAAALACSGDPGGAGAGGARSQAVRGGVMMMNTSVAPLSGQGCSLATAVAPHSACSMAAGSEGGGGVGSAGAGCGRRSCD
jgi:hypothetical protein